MSVIGDAIDRRIAKLFAGASKPGGVIEQGIDAGINRVLRQMAERNETWGMKGDLPPVAFVWQVAFEFLRTDKSMAPTDARDLAVETVRAFLRDEKIKFGNRAYAWDRDAAITLAHEMEIEHWEQAA
jgi:hypothetical protein